MSADPEFLYGLIVCCEIAFWVALATALTLRYVFKRRRASRFLLLLLPVVDLLLLAVTALDLRGGTQATVAHGLAVAYLGFTLTFGPLVIQRADAWFAHRYAGGPRPQGFAASGWPAVLDDLKLWLRCVLAWAVTLLLLGALITFVEDETVIQPLQLWYRIALGSVGVWFVLGPLWSLLFLSWRQSSEA
jgi:hypothetical protein